MRRLPVALGLVLLLACAALPLAGAGPAFAGSSDDQDIADATVLTENDVADYGLSEVRSTSDDPPKGAVCKGIRKSGAAVEDAPGAKATFADGVGTQLENEVAVFETVKEAKAAIAPYLTAKAIKCAERSLKSSLEENLEPGSSYEFSGTGQMIDIGDEGLVLPILVTITDPEGSVTDEVVELGVFRVGRAFVAMNTINVDEPFPGSVELATMIADDLEAEL